MLTGVHNTTIIADTNERIISNLQTMADKWTPLKC